MTAGAVGARPRPGRFGWAACVFDLDGTLWDSLGLWRQIDQVFLARRGLDLPPDYPTAVAALPLDQAARYTIDRFGLLDTVAGLVEEWQAMALEAYSQTIELRPYAKEYLTELKAAGIRLAIATSLSEPLRRPALARHGLTDLFEVVCAADEVDRGKHNPQIYRLAARRLGLPPSRCLVFEDVLAAIRSARAAGLTVYAVRDGQADWPAIARAAHGVVTDFRLAPTPVGVRRRRRAGLASLGV
ncbi:MAG: HAD family phosphatase [Propionibacteriaceae bacterium]|jgi:HAD superfamily hydrolase (TIGR01509 family)|nr:HAD family phosphatase [Propionibacteriaceae bacterium]